MNMNIKVGKLYRARGFNGIPLSYHSWHKDLSFFYHTSAEERQKFGWIPKGTLFMNIHFDYKHHFIHHTHWDRYKFLYIRSDGKIVDAVASLATDMAGYWFEKAEL